VTDNIFSSQMFIAIFPELFLLFLGLIVFILDLILPKEQRGTLGWVMAFGLVLDVGISLLIAQPGSASCWFGEECSGLTIWDLFSG